MYKRQELNLINTLTGELDITVEKVWRDHNAEGRLEEITIVLKGVVKESGQIVYEKEYEQVLRPNVMNQLAETLLKADTATWSHTFEKLPKYDEKQRRIIYSVEEIVLQDNGYDVKIEHKVDLNDNNQYIITVTNTKQGKMTVTKTNSVGNAHI